MDEKGGFGSPLQDLETTQTVTEAEIFEERQVFQKGVDNVEFRTVSWQRAVVVFLKIKFAMSILACPQALARLGAVGGSILIVAFTALNAYTAVLAGGFRNRHPECHMLPDMMGWLWGSIAREIVGVQTLVAQVLVTAAGIVTVSSGLNALSDHGACTVVFAFVGAVLISMCSSIRTLSKLGWLTWFGFALFVAGIFIFTVAVTQVNRPASAPKTGDFELGFVAIAYPEFILGMVQSANLFISTSAGTDMYLPVISEMRRPQDFTKACLWSYVIVGAMYLAFSMVIYAYCGVWLSSPAINSAGPLIKKISYGILLPGLIVGVGIYQHVGAKYAFVRILRDSRHLQKNTAVHWATWLGINVLMGALAFIVAEAVPILNY